MKKGLNFKIIVTEDEDGLFVADCSAIPGCHSQGKTFEAAEKNIKSAIKLCLKVAETDKEYRDSIDFGQKNTTRLIGISELTIPRPSFI